jgi:Leucine-rich repeat (LRR) protein
MLRSIPAELAAATGLKNLVLRDNNIREIPVEVGLISMRLCF